MIALLQRVTHASVTVLGAQIAAIERGLLVFVAIQPVDNVASAERVLERILSYRVFPYAQGRMNRSLRDECGGLLLVPQFTLAADTRKGTRASFTSAAPPTVGANLFAYLVEHARRHYSQLAVGQFGVDMQVALVNDGPVTFWLEV